MATKLSLFSETEFDHRAPDDFPVSCPTLDLAATWEATARHIIICRPPGQTVSKIHQLGPPGSNALDALTVTWKPDGQFLAVGWSDGIVRLMGLENDKTAHHIDVSPGAGAHITHIGWAQSAIRGPGLRLSSKYMHLADELSREWKGKDAAPSSRSLPQELVFLEVMAALPKLSPLPSASAGSGEDDMVFTLRTGIEFLFQDPKPDEYDCVNIMIVGISNGSLHLTVNDSFVVGSFKYPATIPSSSTNLLLRHFSNTHISTQSLLVADKVKQPETLHLLPMDLPFIISLPVNVALLASKLTTLQKLLRYLKQTQMHMCVEWKNTRDLPVRFLRGITGDLESMKTGPRDIVSALYHTVVTGHAYAPVREWLVDTLAERGHKRWDKAVVSGLENLRSLIHENFLPALDRCSIILSRLRGLAQFYDSLDDIGFSVAHITKIMNIITCLRLVGHKVLLLTMDELDHFASFSVWLRAQIDRLASASAEGEELTEKEATMDHGKVLAYIEDYLVETPLRIFFDDIDESERQADLEYAEDGHMLLDVLTAQLDKYDHGEEGMKALPRVEFLVDYASSSSTRLFQSIAEAKRRSVRFGKPVRLSLGIPVDLADGRVCSGPGRQASTYVALASRQNSSQVQLIHIGLDIINGISANTPPTSCCVDLGTRQLIDVKFIDDQDLVLLCAESSSADASVSITTVPFRTTSLQYGSYDPDHPRDVTVVSVDQCRTYQLPESRSSDGKPVRPIRMEVHASNDLRGHIPRRVCLLSSNRTTLRTFELPYEARR